MRFPGTVTLAIVLLALAAPAHATVVGYDITQPSASGPPYPAEPIVFDVFYNGNPFHVLAVQLVDAIDASPLPLNLRGSVEGAGSPFRTGRIDFLPGDLANYPADPIHFDVFFDVQTHPDGPRVLTFAHPPNPIHPPDQMHFDVGFEVVGDGEHVPQAADFAIGAGQPLSFENVVVGPPQSPAFHVFFDVVLAPGVQPLDAPLFTLTLRGSVAQVPAPAGGLLVLVGLAGLLARGAWRRSSGGPSKRL